MPTGHTSRILSGEITTLEEFASECAKSFVWSARDTGEIRYPKSDSYYKNSLAEAMKELEEWDSLDEEGRYAKWSEYATAAETRTNEAVQKAADNYERLIKVQEVLPQPRNVPEEYKNFVSFMHEQIDQTIKFDGLFNEDWNQVIPYVKWCDTKRADILRSITYRAKSLAEEEERIAKSRAWIDGLVKHFGVKVQS